MAGVLGHLIAAPVDFGHEALHPREALDIPRLAANDGALLHRPGGERSFGQMSGEKGEVQVPHG
ncbi:MAG: hypothetical protein R3D46_16955 [Defluviimonas denitrificans]